MRESGVYFFHIPKTAGMTVWKAIESAYDPQRICPWWLWDQLIDKPLEELSKYDVFRGHFYSFLEPYLQRELRKFTILREPVDRTVSYYYYIRDMPDHPNHRDALALSLSEFCLSPKTRYLIENYQAGYLATFVFAQDPARVAARFTAEDRANHLFQAALEPSVAGIEPATLLQAAEEGLRRFSAVGIADKLRLSIDRINAVLGCSMQLPDNRQNATRERIPLASVDPATMKVICSVTEVDREVYRRIASTFPEPL